MSLLLWMKGTWAYKWVAGIVLVILAALYIRKSALDSERLDVLLKEKEKDRATKKVVKEANEKINSDSGFINKWLHETNRFRE